MPQSERKPTLLLLGEHRVAAPVQPQAFKYESRTSLVAYIDDSDEVSVYRLGGQLLHRLEHDDFSGKPTCIEWASRGDSLLVGTDAGTVDRLDLASGRLVQGSLRTGDSSHGAVTGIASHVGRLDGPAGLDGTGLLSSGSQHSTPTDRMAALSLNGHCAGPSGSSDITTPSLPASLARLDASDVLPKLSAIPAPAKAGPGMPAPILRNVQKDLHMTINNKAGAAADSINVMFTTFEGGAVDSSTGDIFTRSFEKASEPHGHFVAQCTSSVHGIHAVASKAMFDEDSSIAMNIDLFQIPFTRSESIHTGTIMANAVQLQRLETYIAQCIDTAALDWSTLTGLPKRFIANVNETLEEKDEGPLQNHFAQLLLTGSCSDIVSEWLKEELAERGHKRWELAMTTFYHAVKHLLEVNLLPALERCSICASSLRGLATYYEGSKNFDVPPKHLTEIIEVLESLKLLAHETLQTLTAEETQFVAFAKWLRIRVDIAASEAGSQTHSELLETEAASTDVALVLSYLTGPLVQSKLEPLIGRKLLPIVMDGILGKASHSHYECVQAAQQLRKSESTSSDIVYLPLQLRYLHRAVDTCLTQMKRWQSSSWTRPSEVITAFDAPLSILDVKLRDRGEGCTVNVIGTSAEQPSLLYAHEVPVSYDKKLLSIREGIQQRSTFELPSEMVIVDLKLLQAGGIILLVHSDSGKSTAILQIPATLLSDKPEHHSLLPQDLEKHTIHSFDASEPFEARHVFVSEGRRGTSLVVLDKTRSAWRILSLPNSGGTSNVSPEHLARTPFGLADGDEMLVD